MSTPIDNLDIPSSDATVSVKAFNTLDAEKSYVPAAFFMTPVLPGREQMYAPAFAFLIENPRLGRRVMFDLGQRDVTTGTPPVVEMVNQVGAVFVADDVVDQLVSNNIDLESINSVIWSHIHFDHIGDTGRFPSSTELVVGRGTDLTTYPTNPASTLLDRDIQGRQVRELSYDALKIGGFDAHDFFGDGSLYLLDCPGHVGGHTCALARVEPQSFVFLGGDICHHPGQFRPTEALHRTVMCPGHILAGAHKAISTEHFGSTGAEGTFDLTKRTEPMLDIVEGGVHEDSTAAKNAIRQLLAFDASHDVLVVIAHDLTLVGELPLYPESIDDWKKTGLKEKVTWAGFEEENSSFRYSDCSNRL